MRHFAAILSAAGCSLYRVGRGTPQPLGRAATPQALGDLLAGQARARDDLTLYSDFAEESYVRSELPRLWSGAMRQQLLARRLRQQYPDHTYRAAVVEPVAARWQPPVAASLLALPALPAVQQVVDLAHARGLRVAGMWPISQLLGTLAVGPESTLLTLQLPSGLRHVLAVGRTAVFSRLLPEPDTGPALWLEDAERTAQYLASQGWVPGAELRTQIWHSMGEAVNAGLYDELNRIDLAGARHVRDIYQLALAAGRPVQGQLLPADSTAAWRAARTGRVALGLAAAGLGAALAYAGVSEWRTRELRAQAETAPAETQRAAEQTARTLATARGRLDEAELAQVAVQTWTQAVEAQPDAPAALATLSTVLADFPTLRLVRVAWRAGKPATSDCQPPADAGQGAAAAPAADPASAPAWNNQLQLTLGATLPSTMALRERLEVQRRLEQALQARGWTLRVVKPFVELGAGAPGSGLLGEPSEATMVACATIARR